MKKIFFIVLISLAMISQAFAVPGLHFGVKIHTGIANISNIKSDVDSVKLNLKSVLGLGFGVTVGVNAGNHLGLQGEILYSKQGQKTEYEWNNIDSSVTYYNHYVQVPLLAKISTSSAKPLSFNFVAGPQFGILLGTQVKPVVNGNSVKASTKPKFKTADVGIAFGPGLEFGKIIHLTFGFRFAFGLTDTGIDPTDVTKNSTKSVYAGITF